jgi:hypothetical protein
MNHSESAPSANPTEYGIPFFRCNGGGHRLGIQANRVNPTLERIQRIGEAPTLYVQQAATRTNVRERVESACIRRHQASALAPVNQRHELVELKQP